MRYAVIFLLLLPAAARAVNIGGAVVINYHDREGQTGLTANAGNGTFNITQVSLNLTQDFTDWSRMAATINSNGTTFGVSEAWMGLSVLPYSGEFTAGRFYKPLGAPLQTLGLTYPALLFHTSPVDGVKMNMEYYPWSWELGVVNNNALSATGSNISGSAVFGRPNALANGNNKEGYGFLRWRNGGEWGALDVNAGYTIGEFSKADQAVLSAQNFIINSRGRSDRRIVEFAVDYTYGPFRAFGHHVQSNEGILHLVAYNVSGSYRVGKFNYTFGYDRLTNNAITRPLAAPGSWRRKRFTYNATWEYRPSLQFALEYEDNKEDITGSPVIRDLPNDAWTFQMTAFF